MKHENRIDQGEVEEQAITFVQSLGIHSIPTSPEIDLHDFIERAVKWESPFKDKDRGFRDAVILDTVIWHMKHKKIEEAILLTSDKGSPKRHAIDSSNKV